MTFWRVLVVASTALALVASCASASAEPYDVTQAQWDAGLARLAQLRASFPKQAYTRNVTVTFFEPRSRRRFEGRGAVGVDPGHAMRLMLVGPAGEIALDVWVTRDHWRMSVPAIHFLKRGGTESPTGMPIGFFRSWFVDPLAGRPLALGREGQLIVRDTAGGTLHIAPTTNGADIVRRHGAGIETFSYDETRAHYVDHATGVEVDVGLEPPQDTPPLPQAFVDPDS
jgi:hypothetical protein